MEGVTHVLIIGWADLFLFAFFKIKQVALDSEKFKQIISYIKTRDFDSEKAGGLPIKYTVSKNRITVFKEHKFITYELYSNTPKRFKTKFLVFFNGWTIFLQSWLMIEPPSLP